MRDKTLKFYYEANPIGVNGYTYIRNAEIAVTYTEVDTYRAALIFCVP